MAKGGNYEREIFKKLSLWWTNNERDDVFWRTNSSGARATQRKKGGKDTAYQAGDMTFTDPIGEPLVKIWNVECKTGYAAKKKTEAKVSVINWCVLDILDSKQKVPVFINMWQQCNKDAKTNNREPILIFRRNHMQSCIAIKISYFNKLKDHFGTVLANKLQLKCKGLNITIIGLASFLDWTALMREYLEGQK